MGHYDDCYAFDDAEKKPVSKEEIKALEELVAGCKGVICYSDDYNSARNMKIARLSNILEIVEEHYKIYRIVLNAGAIRDIKIEKILS